MPTKLNPMPTKEARVSLMLRMVQPHVMLPTISDTSPIDFTRKPPAIVPPINLHRAVASKQLVWHHPRALLCVE